MQKISNISIEISKGSVHNLVFTVKSTGSTLTIRDYDKTSANFAINFGDQDEIYSAEKSKDGKYSLKKMKGTKDSWLGVRSSSSSYITSYKGDIVNKTVKEHEEATKAQPPRDPLIINFSNDEDNNGLVGVDNGVYFDLDNNGVAEKTAWIDSNKGFLALDRDGDGKITNGGELFGDQVTLASGKTSASGFEALAELDDNVDEATGAVGDGVIDKNDSLFDQLRVWIDEKRNGVSEDGELKTLSELGIASISLNTENKGFVDTDTKTSITETAEVRLNNGKTLDISEHWFEVHTFDTQEVNVNGENIDSPFTFGNLPSIERFIDDNETNEAKQLYDRFINSDDYVEKRILAKKILYVLS